MCRILLIGQGHGKATINNGTGNPREYSEHTNQAIILRIQYTSQINTKPQCQYLLDTITDPAPKQAFRCFLPEGLLRQNDYFFKA